MKVWEINTGNSIDVSIEDDLNPDIDALLRSISFGEEIKHKWKPLKAVHKREMGKSIHFPYLTPGKMILNDQALLILEPLIVDLVEILPLQNEEYNFFI